MDVIMAARDAAGSVAVATETNGVIAFAVLATKDARAGLFATKPKLQMLAAMSCCTAS
jgi:hypothetical protein